MRSIAQAVRQFKRNWLNLLETNQIEAVCLDVGHVWRERVLSPAVTVQVLLLQVLHGNAACSHVARLAQLSFTPAAYCQARQRLKLDVLVRLLRSIVEQYQHDTFDQGRWRGHRLFLIDGSNFSMPDTPALREYFGQPGMQQTGCGFPIANWLALMHAGSGMIAQMWTGPLRTHDMSSAAHLHPALQSGDVLVGDRGFCSYAHLALLWQRQVHGVLRMHQRINVDFTPHRPFNAPRTKHRMKGQPSSRWLKELGVADQCVEWFKAASQRPVWMQPQQYAALPDSLVLRELRYRVERRGFRVQQVTLVTTLLDPDLYPVEALADLYRQRWQIETDFRHLKTTMQMEVLKCRTVSGILKELHGFAIVYNLVRQVILEASQRQQVNMNRISFVAALRWLQTARPHEPLPPLQVNPNRNNRHEPRTKKRRPKNYPLLNQPRWKWKQKLAKGMGLGVS